jgi:hypothetical protein
MATRLIKLRRHLFERRNLLQSVFFLQSSAQNKFFISPQIGQVIVQGGKIFLTATCYFVF